MRPASGWRLAVGIVAAAAIVAPALVAGRAHSAQGLRGTVLDLGAPSPGLAGTISFVAYLPPGYATSGKRYPVVYFLHGLPADSSAYRGVAPIAAAVEQLGRDAIVIEPQGAKDGDIDPEYLNWGPGRDWETAITRDLRAYVDAHFRTIADRRARALVGISAGGYGAFLLGLHHLDEYSVVESWSGYFHPTDPTGKQALELGSADRDLYASAHALVPALRARLRQNPTFLAFYVGRADPTFYAENLQLHHELAAAHIPHVFEVYAGGHDSTVWNAHAPMWLGLALARMLPPQAAAGSRPAEPASAAGSAR